MQREIFTIPELLKRAAAAGVFLSYGEGKLQFKLSVDNFPEALKSEIVDHKEALIAFLKQRSLEESSPSSPVIHALERPIQSAALSYAQQRLWFIDQLGGSSVQYNMPGAMCIQGKFSEDVAERALARIIERHEPLRTVFLNGEEGPEQHIQTSFEFRLTRIDLSRLSREEQEQAVQEALDRDAGKAFDLSADLMLRASFLRLTEEEGVLQFNMHHIASDGWSMGILVEEFGRLYEAFAEGGEDPLEPLGIQYADYAQWQRGWLKGKVLERQLSYWEKQLADLPEVHGLPLDRPRPAVQTFDGRVHRVEVERETLEGLKQVAGRSQATLYMVLQGAFALLLSRYGNSSDIVMGTPVANRSQKELEPLVGFFVNTLVLRTDCAGGRRFREYLEQVKSVNLDAQGNQDVPFEYLVERLKPRRSTSHGALFQIMFSMNTNEVKAVELPGLRLSPLVRERAAVKFDLTLEVLEQGAGVKLSFAYNRDLFEAETIARMAQHYLNLVGGIVGNAGKEEEKIEALPLLSEGERQQLLYELNDTQADYPRDVCLHELIEAQVEKTPEAVAVVYEGRQVSYRELNRRANQLGHYLRKQGVRADTLVGLCVERSVEMVVGILGILKAGGAYVPLDPGYPQERLEYMIGDSAPAVVLTQQSVEDRLPPMQSPRLRLDTDGEELEKYSAENLGREEAGLTPEHLAYVIYTSGSTGKPKGVMNAHSGVVNGLLWARGAYGLSSEDRILQKTPYSFDVSVWEFLLPLLSGAQLVMARPGGHLDPQYLAEVMEREQITMVHFVPSMLQVFLEHGVSERCKGLRRVLCSGEALPYATQVRFEASLPGVELHNLYGPTEAAVHVSYWQCRQGVHEGIVPIGRPIANTQIYLLDSYLQPVPQGVSGELYIGGAGVARGYWNRPELTEERFVEDRFSGKRKARMYRTGDLARWLSDGAIEYLGRNDTQVKIRGLRIELGEIEAALLEQEGVEQAAVIMREDVPGQKRLVAYLGCKNRSMELKSSVLADCLRKRLPEYMVPLSFITIEELPLTSSGKVNRQALPEPGDACLFSEYVRSRFENRESAGSNLGRSFKA